MVEELATQEKQEVTVYDTGTHVVKILEDHMEGAYYLDEIAVQASVYQSFQENSGNRYRPNHEIGQSSQRTRGESNLQSASAYDEVLAQQCQLLEDCSADALESTINHPGDGVNTTESSTRNAGSSSNGNPRLVIREDNIDSDSMSYEMCHLQIKLQKTEVDHFALLPLLPFALHHSLVEGKQEPQTLVVGFGRKNGWSASPPPPESTAFTGSIRRRPFAHIQIPHTLPLPPHLATPQTP
ncbi:hypothetical protein ZIOFF_076193 [Zingiber officinale]|uniref:Uncharacterized protein n=1 Tax=Zingiber officinale TaxID=94328 RepID=A0A8J5C3E7_ZINOF|nr:hypothetical protein ZIOFF_076193 [Zingiber officinale]